MSSQEDETADQVGKYFLQAKTEPQPKRSAEEEEIFMNGLQWDPLAKAVEGEISPFNISTQSFWGHKITSPGLMDLSARRPFPVHRLYQRV
jgi:hypothetical protein